MTKVPIHKCLLLSVCSLTTYLAVSMAPDVKSDAKSATFGLEVEYRRVQILSYNRYQVGSVCKERGWEFCKSWSRYSRTRLA